jgi:hypothetical protein
LKKLYLQAHKFWHAKCYIKDREQQIQDQKPKEDPMKSMTLLKDEEVRVHEPELIDVDMPFDAKEVEEATSKGYVEHLTRSDMPIVPPRLASITAGKNRNRAAVPTEHVFDPIDVDIPFSAAEVTALTCEAYVAALGPSDIPVVGHWMK